ncbi:MAG: hypothetical protein V2A73_12695, partial [Pseudomonadota bacterium]
GTAPRPNEYSSRIHPRRGPSAAAAATATSAAANAAALALLLIVGLSACKRHEPPTIDSTWTDSFDRSTLGSDWYATQDSYFLRDGKLNARGAHNHPLWLRRKLPRDAIVELDCWSESPSGDLKVEAWGDGESFDPDQGAYLATAYVLVMGGWNNSQSIIARRDEHAPGIPRRNDPKVEPGRKYHWKIVRKGGQLRWFVDDMTTPFLSLDDPAPLEGQDHEYFAINNWESDVWFDNLAIRPAE